MLHCHLKRHGNGGQFLRLRFDLVSLCCIRIQCDILDDASVSLPRSGVKTLPTTLGVDHFNPRVRVQSTEDHYAIDDLVAGETDHAAGGVSGAAQ